MIAFSDWFDFGALAVYVGYMVIFLVWPVRNILVNSLPPASAVVIVCEQVTCSCYYSF